VIPILPEFLADGSEAAQGGSAVTATQQLLIDQPNAEQLTKLIREGIPACPERRTRRPKLAPVTPKQAAHNRAVMEATVYTRKTRPRPRAVRVPVPGRIRALTVRPPWSDCIAYADKRVENRSWSPPAWRGLLLIHAGLTVIDDALPLVAGLLPVGHQLVRGAVVAVADLADIHPDDGRCTPWSETGQYHWVLENVEPLATPVPWTGALGLWTPGEVLLDAVAATSPTIGDRIRSAR